MELEPIYTLANPFEADMIVEALTLEGIPFQIESPHTDPLQVTLQLQEGIGHVRVAPEHRQQALELIQAVLNAPMLDPDAPSDSST